MLDNDDGDGDDDDFFDNYNISVTMLIWNS